MNASSKISSVSQASQVHDDCCVPLKSFLICNCASDSDQPLLSIYAQHTQKVVKMDGELVAVLPTRSVLGEII